MGINFYPVYLETDDDFASFGVVVPDLPGCVSAGDSVEEALAMAKEAIEFHLEGMVDGGEAVPNPRPVTEHLQQKADWFCNPGLWAVVSVNMPELAEAV